MCSKLPITDPSVGDLDIMKSGLHSLGGRLSCMLTEPVNDLDLDISLDWDDGLELSENGVLDLLDDLDPFLERDRIVVAPGNPLELASS